MPCHSHNFYLHNILVCVKIRKYSRNKIDWWSRLAYLKSSRAKSGVWAFQQGRHWREKLIVLTEAFSCAQLQVRYLSYPI